MKRLVIDSRVGDAVCEVIEHANGRECHIVIIALPIEPNGKLGQPSFCTSLQPAEMEDVVTQIAGGFALAGKRIVKSAHTRDH